MNDRPGQPAEQAAHPQPLEADHRAKAPDGRHAAEVSVPERRRSSAFRPPAGGWSGRRAAPVAWRPRRRRGADRGWSCRRWRRPLGASGSVQSGRVSIRPARSQTAPDASASRRASGEACTPAAQITVRASIRSGPPGPSNVTDSASTAVTLTPIRSSTPMVSSSRAAISDSRSPNAAQRLVTGVEQQDANLRGIDPSEAGAEGAHGQRADLAGDLDAGRRRRRRWPPSATPAACRDLR